MMNLPEAEQFAEFYEAVYGYEPFPWQRRLAAMVGDGEWPPTIALPTAAGKTCCIDIAVYALACRAKNAPRRIFFVVDRRIVVDQAFRHALRLSNALKNATSGILLQIAASLLDLAQEQQEAKRKPRPIDVYPLRGGIYRETAWTRSPLQPIVIASTVDQIGSRLLFRGYGVSDSMRPIHAGLVGNDALILLDEAHCARPFDQTMAAVLHYRNSWNESHTPFHFTSITATPTGIGPTLSDEQDDREHPVLGKRITASKPTRLVVAEKAKGRKGNNELVKVLSEEARQLGARFACVGIIVNRVKTARELKKALGDDAVLLTGRMRPIDRDRLFDERLRPLLSDAKPENGAPPKYVIGTQCLECGADFDFHALVTECASFDALRQRFGRLNRVGQRTSADAVIVVRGDETNDTSEDPVYGASLAETWKWLTAKAKDDTFDFGISAVRAAMDGSDIYKLNAPTADAPVLLPAHLDCWVQTNPRPTIDPEPAPFLHGSAQSSQPDVQVVFRSDLGTDTERWSEIVALIPPSSSEAVTVPIGVFKKWLEGATPDDLSGDIEGEKFDEDEDAEQQDLTTIQSALRWLGPEKSRVINNSADVVPNNVYVISSFANGCESLGDFPYGLLDRAEEAFQLSRDNALLRLTDSKVNKEDDEFADLLSAEIQLRSSEQSPSWLSRAVQELMEPKRRDVDEHPLGGFVVTGKRRLGRFDPTYLEDGEPEESFHTQREVALKGHTLGVADHARRFAEGCGLDPAVYEKAGLWHDIGKLDLRFQAMLRQSSPRTAFGDPLAKSARSPRTRWDKEQARKVHKYPAGGRHELLSAALLAEKTDDDLILHLIATHHGSGRPFADPVFENDAANAPFCIPDFLGERFEVPSAAQRICDWNAELPERFWRIVRKYGWWGSAFREAVFRLADHAQSRAEQQESDLKERKDPNLAPSAQRLTMADSRPFHLIKLPGLDGANPLGFLAALGTLTVLDQMAAQTSRPTQLEGGVSLAWEGLVPVLHVRGFSPFEPDQLTAFLNKNLCNTLETHSAKTAIELFENSQDFTLRLREIVVHSVIGDQERLAWVAALVSDALPDATSQLLMVRRDYYPDNVRSILSRCRDTHLVRALTHSWDYADALDNQSLHWEPSEDRRHAYQWHMPSGDPTRKKRGGMLGANRLAFEAWPLFPSMPMKNRLATRGFRGSRAKDTMWTWPLWQHPLTRNAIGSLLALPELQEDEPSGRNVQQYGITRVFRARRIVVGKTPNLTAPFAIA